MAIDSQITKEFLSGSTNGRGIKVVATATLGTVIHTEPNVTDQKDEVWLTAWNSDGTARLLTIEFGGVTDPDDIIEITLAANAELKIIVPGQILDGGVVVTAFAAAANVIVISGWVNRILETTV